jgi:SAM-dependent methyltransferase
MMENVYSIVSIGIAGTVLLAALSIVYVTWKNGISPMPASAPVRRRVAAEINRMARNGTIVEAGSGWGTLALYLARYCPDMKLIGIENSPVPLWVSRLAARGKNVTFSRENIYSFSYDPADIIVCYLYPGAMERLAPVFERQLARGGRLISVCFAWPDRKPERVVTCDDLYHTKVYVY